MDFKPLVLREVTICPISECLKEANKCPLHSVNAQLMKAIEESLFHRGLEKHGEIRLG